MDRTAPPRATISRHWPTLAFVATLLVPPLAAAQAPLTDAERRCAEAVQGKVAWNRGGNRQWDPQNMATLCRGTTDVAATIACFSAEIVRHGEWSRSISACAVKAAQVPQTPAVAAPPPVPAPPVPASSPTPAVVPPTTAGGCAQPWWRDRVRASIGEANWMSVQYDLLCRIPLNELALPGSHDAGTYELQRTLERHTTLSNLNEVYAPDNDALKRFLSTLPVATFYNWAKTHRRTAAEQLADGIRYFDLRVCIDGNNRLMTCHGLYGAALGAVLDDVKKFVDAHPGEIVILGFNHFWDGPYQQQQVAANPSRKVADIEGLRPEMWTLLVNTIKTKLAGKLMPSSIGARATYSDVMGGASAAATRQVIAMFDTDAHPYVSDPAIWTQMEAGGTWVGEIWERDSFLKESRRILANAARGDYAGKFWAIRSSVTPTIELYARSFDPTGTFPNSLEELAAQTNPVVFAMLRDEWRGRATRREKPVNLIWSDFYDGDDLVKLAKHLNGIAVNWSGTTVGKTVTWGSWRGIDHSYGRGVGKPMACAADEQQDGALCYPRCRDGYGGAGPVCWQRCPGTFSDTGAHCLKPQAYPNGAGFPWQFGDALNDDGMISRCQASHGAGNCEKHGLIFYPKCRAGFAAFGGNVCSPVCPAGMTDIGVSCQKQSYGRTAGRPLGTCAAGLEADAGLCYPACKAEFKGVGPMCWPSTKLR